jgi:hypothetical protein
MKVAITTTAAILMAGAFAWAPVYSATGDSGQTYTAPATGAQAPAVQPPAGGNQPSESMMPGKDSATCARLDKDSDGYITWPEFKASGQSNKVFKSADAEHRGKLNMEECGKALSS